ncbi:3-deoxy-7-phosphoheptulonate synthase [Xenorhabdus bovienii]|uniref:Phospho-2-dehydro-3-deoxyheptonate aldolase n=1 Tax=Xenorhabdus bovienii str. kraussei Becker Underwood TaxID=1398204 RepID=A0A077PPT3_XENBV|nr:hypothetical protein XBKB1_570019 [Xenorhabdus bovienii str. kraussei Becker Underwood]
MCGSMHGNTTKTTRGNKYRDLAEMEDEITGFQFQLAEHNACYIGIHLETTTENIAECFGYDFYPNYQK